MRGWFSFGRIRTGGADRKHFTSIVHVHKFTTDNKVSIEFDLFSFSVKDFQVTMTLMRCESRGDIYPITTYTTSINKVDPTSSFAAVSSYLWHDRLGHPGEHV